MKVLIMCGGAGKRLWPKSCAEKPKQFQAVLDDKTMMQHTYERMSKYVSKDDIYFSTTDEYSKYIFDQITEVNTKNIIIEPLSKNTAPSILLSVLYIYKQIKSNFNLIIVPSDHLILNESEFIKKLENAEGELKQNKDRILTFGIIPNRIETGYGYINTDMDACDNYGFFKANSFVEKPNYELAKKYYDSKKYLWNSGIYIFNSNFILNEFKKNNKKDFDIINNIVNNTTDTQMEYNKCKNISIDYAIMEKSNDIYVMPVDFQWDDLGTWRSLKKYLLDEGKKNYKRGNVTFNNCINNFVYSDDKKIIINDLDDIYCINCNGKIIVGKIDKLSDVYLLKENEK